MKGGGLQNSQLTKTNKLAKRELTKVVTEPPKLLIRFKKLSWHCSKLKKWEFNKITVDKSIISMKKKTNLTKQVEIVSHLTNESLTIYF